MKKKIFIAIVIVIALVGAPLAVFLKTAYVVPVIMYHSMDYNDKDTKLTVSPEAFARQMEFLYRHKYNVVGMDKIVSYLEKKEPIPPKTIAITFDDGLYDNYKYAYPVLKKYNLPATFFIIIKKIGEPGYVGWKEIKEMADSGVITIGSHTVMHFWLPAMGSKELKRELEDSRAILEKGIGRPVLTLCYPIGAHDERVEGAVKAAGYMCAVGTNPGRSAPNDDVFAVKRIKISRTSNNLFVFWFETSGYYTYFKERHDD